jgi:hypothetical protein
LATPLSITVESPASVLAADRLDQLFLDVVAHSNSLGHVLSGSASVLRTMQQRAEVTGNS